MAEEKKIKRSGVLTSGGDAPGMNAAVRALDEGRKNIIVGTKEGALMEIPIEEALNMKKGLQMGKPYISGCGRVSPCRIQPLQETDNTVFIYI